MDMCISGKENAVRETSHIKKEELNYTPHFATLTETGQANFSRLSDAIAEFIDNALSACSLNTGNRSIRVSVCLDEDINEITIRDNGQGMTREGIRAFATYFLTQEERDQAPSEIQLAESLPGQYLGKYGVGAMQAGFFIGSRIELHTKSLDDDYVLQFEMDEEIYRQRQSRGDVVYCDPLVERLPGVYVYSDGGVRSKQLNRLLEEEKIMPQFTCITLRVRPKFETKLNKAGFTQRLINELSHIYHYHLHDEDWPANAKHSGRYLKPKRRKGDKRQSTVDKVLSSASSELEMHVEIWEQGGIKMLDVNLSNVDSDLESRRVGLNGMAKDMFSFAFEVRNPSEKGPQWLNCTGACYYFPTASGRETRPADDEDFAENDMFNPEFEKRLIPQSHVRRLPFFPSGNLSREDRDTLGSWQKRVGTVLHFPYHCPTSNNKLKILLGPDLTNYLCDKEMAMFNGKKLSSGFKSWLATCNSLYNDVVTFGNPLIQQQYDTNTAGISLWGECSFGTSGRVLRIGDKVKLISKPVIFGSIVRFETEGVDAQGRATHAGACVIVCRHPQEIFGLSDEQSHALARIDPLESMALEELWDEYMVRLQLLLYKAGGRPVGKELIFSCKDWAVWSPFQVRIMNGSKPPQVITKFPLTNEPLSIFLEIRVGATDSGKSVAKFELGNFSLTEDHSSLLFKKIKALSVPGSYNARFWVSPKGGLEKRVLIRVLPAEPATLSVTWTNDKQSSVEHSLQQLPKAGEGTGTPIPEFEIGLHDSKGNGCPMDVLKSISLSCSTEAERKLLNVTLRNDDSSGEDNISSAKKICSEFYLENSGTETLVGQEFSDGKWVLHPLCQGILAKLREESKRAADGGDNDGYDDLSPISIGIEFTATLESGDTLLTVEHIRFGPGTPAGICLCDSMSPYISPFQPVRVEDGCTLPPMLTKLMDVNDNPTLPGRTATYVVKVFSDEPDSVIFGSSTSTPPFCTSFDVRSNGESELKGIVASVSDECIATAATTSHETTLLIQLFEQRLRKKSRKLSSRSVDVGSSDLEERVGETLKLRVTILLGQSIGLSIPQECLPEGGTSEVGTVIKGLQVKFVGCNAEEYPNADRIRAIVQDMYVSWNSSWRWTPVDLAAASASDYENNNNLLVNLPDLDVPTKLEKDGGSSDELDPFQVKVHTKKRKEIVCALHLKIIAGPAVAWGRATSHSIDKSSIIDLGGGRDLGNTIGPITPVDKYGNPSVEVDDLRCIISREQPNLKIDLDFARTIHLDISGVETDQTKQQLDAVKPYLRPPSPMLEKVGRYTYLLPDDVTAFRGKGHSLDGYIVVSSSAESEWDLKPLRIPARFLGGPLASLSVKAPSIGIQEWSVGDNITGSIQANMEILDFAVQGLDESGDGCTPPATDGHHIVIMIRDENGAEISCSNLVLDRNGEGLTEAFKIGLDDVNDGIRVVFVEVRQDGDCKLDNVKPVIVRCDFVRSNCITALYLAAVHGDDFANIDRCIADFKHGDVSFKQLHTEGLSMGNVGTSVMCDAHLPNLVVWCNTEDKNPFIPTLSTLQFKLQHEDKSRNPIPFEDAYYCEDSSIMLSKMAILLKAKTGFEPAFVGHMTIGCFYTENRDSILELLEISSRPSVTSVEDDLELTIQIVPGALASLSPHSDSMSKLQNIACGNRDGCDETALSERSLVSGPVYFIGLDAYGNETSVTVPIVALIAGNTASINPPLLEDSDVSGYLFSEECDAQSLSSNCNTNRSSIGRKKHRKNKQSGSTRRQLHDPLSTQNIIYQRFSKLRIEAGSGQTPGSYELVVKYQDSGVTADVQPWVTQIRFADDSKRIEHLHTLQEQLQSHEELLKRARDAEAEATMHAEEAIQDLESYIESNENEGYLPHLDTLQTTDLLDLASSCNLLEEIAEEARNTRRELQDMSSTYSPRPPVYPPKMEHEANALKLEGCLGHIVKLGFVSDNHLARLLSWTVQNRLKAVLLKTKEEQSRAARGGLATFSMDTIRPFKVRRREKRSSAGFTTVARSREDVEAQIVPLPPVDTGTEGFIGYAVNLIILPQKLEYLRDTLFWALYGHLCVFETLEQMSNHAERLKSRNRTAVTMISLDGYKRDATGFVDGSKNAILEPSRSLSYVYGAPPDLQECAVMKQRLDSLEELLPLLERVVRSNEGALHATDKILTRGESIASLQQDVDSLRKEIALVASVEQEIVDCDQQDMEKNMDILTTATIHNAATKCGAANDIEKSSGKKRVVAHKNRSGKRISR